MSAISKLFWEALHVASKVKLFIPVNDPFDDTVVSDTNDFVLWFGCKNETIVE